MNTSSECATSLHGLCPGFYKMSHPCRCTCHQKLSSPERPLEAVLTTSNGEEASEHHGDTCDCWECDGGAWSE